MLERLLPIIDDVDRALGAAAEEPANDWVNGFRLIQRKLQGLLESEGATPIPTEGQKFDPEPAPRSVSRRGRGYSEGDIIGEVPAGYKLGDRFCGRAWSVWPNGQGSVGQVC